MKIRECAWCGKAIYGENCYMGTGGYYHKECQLFSIGGHSRSIVTNPDSSTEVMFQELTQLKELNRELVAWLIIIKGHIQPRSERKNVYFVEMEKKLVKRIEGVIAKAEEKLE